MGALWYSTGPILQGELTGSFMPKQSTLTNRRLLRLFKVEGLSLSRLHHAKFIEYAKSHTENNKGQTSSKLLRSLVSNFLGASPETTSCYFTPPTRAQKNYYKSGRKNTLLPMLGRNSKRKFAVKQSYPSPEGKRLKELLSSSPSAARVDFRFSGLEPCSPGPNGSPHLLGPNKTPYREAMRASKATLFIEASPDKDKHRTDFVVGVDFDKQFAESFFHEKAETTSFSFVVTANGIKQRAGESRSCGQKEAVGGYSAAEIFEKLGVQFNKKISKHFHLAHRHGWGLGGAQVKANIDPATAGSNYTTLFWIESTIRYLLNRKDIAEINVQGSITFHKDIPGLPEKITYTCSWPQGEFVKDIYPLRPRRPTIDEFHASNALALAEHEIYPPQRLNFD